MAPALGALAEAAQGLRIRLRELAPDLGLEAVASGLADVAIVHDWVHDRTTFAAGLVAVHLADDPVDLVVPAAHRLAERRTAALSETVTDVWVTDVSDSICTRWILDMLHASTEKPRVDFRAEGYASQVALVSAGLCVAVLPRLGRPALPDTVRVIRLRGPVPTRRFLAVYRTPTSRRPAIRRLIEALGEQTRPGPTSGAAPARRRTTRAGGTTSAAQPGGTVTLTPEGAMRRWLASARSIRRWAVRSRACAAASGRAASPWRS